MNSVHKGVRVAIVTNVADLDLEDRINDKIIELEDSGNTIIDIKYTQSEDKINIHFSALIIYF